MKKRLKSYDFGAVESVSFVTPPFLYPTSDIPLNVMWQPFNHQS